MRTQAFALGIAAAAMLATGACSKSGNGNGAPQAQTKDAKNLVI